MFIRVLVEPATCAPVSAAELGTLAEKALRELYGSEGADIACQLKALRKDVLRVTPADGTAAVRKRAADAHAAAVAALAAYSGGGRGVRVICEHTSPFAAALAAPADLDMIPETVTSNLTTLMTADSSDLRAHMLSLKHVPRPSITPNEYNH